MVPTPSVTRLYEAYADTELTFNTQVILASGLVTSEISLSVGERRVPCVLYASSMKGARVIAELEPPVLEHLEKAGNVASLRYAFRTGTGGERALLSFFVPARATSFAEYNAHKPHAKFVTLSFTQRPADALITTLGALLELRSNAAQRRDERIVLTPESMKSIGLESRESCVAIEGAARRCLVRDLSFGGAKILMTAQGLPRSPGHVSLKLNRCELRDDTVLDGSVVRVEDVEGRSDLLALSIRYTAEPPLSYKQRINGFFTGHARA